MVQLEDVAVVLNKKEGFVSPRRRQTTPACWVLTSYCLQCYKLLNLRQ